MTDPAFLFYTKDFISGTSDMDVSEVGAYIRLLCYQHQNDGVPNQNERMARICGVTLEQFLQMWETLKFKFSETKDGRLFNKRLNNEVEKRSNSGKHKKILGIYGAIIKNSDYSLEQKNAIKSSFNADDFVEYPDNQIKEEILSWLAKLKLSLSNNIANANADEIDSSLLLEEGVGETSSSLVKPIAKVTTALKKLDMAGEISLDDVESQFFNGKGIEFVIQEFQKHFQSIGYVYKSDKATLSCFLGWRNQLNKKSTWEGYKKKGVPVVKMTESSEAEFAKFMQYKPKVIFLCNFLWQEPPEDRPAYFKSLISKYGLEGAMRKIAEYHYNPIGGQTKETWKNFQLISPIASMTNEEWKEVKEAHEIEL